MSGMLVSGVILVMHAKGEPILKGFCLLTSVIVPPFVALVIIQLRMRFFSKLVLLARIVRTGSGCQERKISWQIEILTSCLSCDSSSSCTARSSSSIGAGAAADPSHGGTANPLQWGLQG